MKPSRSQAMYLHRYFKNILGYGNKCPKCKRQGSIRQITDGMITFYCRYSNFSWAFETKITPEDMILKVFRK